MTRGTSFTIAMPRNVHLGSYLRQSDAEHLPNVSFLIIVEESESGEPRYRANAADLFFKARYELPPGTILYADISAFFYEFIYRTPGALRNSNDSAWDSPFPAVEPGVSSCMSGLPCLLPESTHISMDLSASGTCVRR